MKFRNFELNGILEAIEILCDGVRWDLHNLADFQGFEYQPRTGTLSLQWIGSEGPEVNDPIVLASVVDKTWKPRRVSLSLVFYHVAFLRMLGYNDELVESEITLEGISRVHPGDLEPSLRVAREGEESFILYFEFASGRTIEIGAQEAVFVRGHDA